MLLMSITESSNHQKEISAHGSNEDKGEDVPGKNHGECPSCDD